jgi:acetate kinase
MKILVLNSGSSSQKACIYEIQEALPVHPSAALWEGKIEWGNDTAAICVKSAGTTLRTRVPFTSREQLLQDLLSTAWRGNTRVLDSSTDIDAVGHRIVHGGPNFEHPVPLTPEVRNAIAAVSPFAPLHIDAELKGVSIIDNLVGAVPQIAVFDTGFHRHMPLAASVYPGPYEWFENGIRRYGFHGINHQYCAERAAQLLRREGQGLKIVSCHLGNGCSVAAVWGNRSVDTTMGFTPLDGLMMGTRSGAVDPGIVTFLMRQQGLNANQIDALLNHRSGLLGISGISADMRDILALKLGDERAKLAFDIYVHRLRAAIAAMAASMDGIDVLVFTAGVGENSPEVRDAACSALEFIGIRIDAQKNASPLLDANISAANSAVRVLVIRAEEDWVIAKECWNLLRAAPVHEAGLEQVGQAIGAC